MNKTIDIPKKKLSLLNWLNYIENLNQKKIQLGLKRVLKVAKKLNLLKKKFIVFTVSGTNGKGTTCKSLETFLISAGYNVGSYNSPHLINYTERIKINGNELCEDMHISSFSKIEYYRSNIPLTYFEYSTLSALLLFQEFNLDILILEVGLGGRLDATNIIDPDVAIITNVGFDHTEFLGSTLNDIGFEKSGIFRSNKPAIFGGNDLLLSVKNFAEKINSKLLYKNFHWKYVLKKTSWSFYFLNKKIEDLPIPFNIPIENIATALAGIYSSPIKINDNIIFKSIKKITLPGRFQIIPINYYKIILDVAHNPDAALYLANSLKLIKFNKIHAIIGMLKEKDIKNTILNIKNIINYWYCSALNTERSASVDDLYLYLPVNRTKKFNKIKDALLSAQTYVQKEDIILVFGSFYTVSEVMKILFNNKSYF